jgi:hypothetical protein
MSKSDIYIASLVFACAVYLLVTYNQDAQLQGWSARFSVGGVLSGWLMMLLSQKSSLFTLVTTFLLIGTLLLNTCVVYCASLFPGETVTFKSPASAPIGGLLVRLMGIGLLTLLKNLFVVLVQWLDLVLAPRTRYLACLQGA